MFKPKSVNILGRNYQISFLSDMRKVNADGDRLRQGEISFYDPGIRVFDNGKLSQAEILGTLFEEVMHGIEEHMYLSCFKGKNNHRQLAALCSGLADVFLRNGWWKEK